MKRNKTHTNKIQKQGNLYHMNNKKIILWRIYFMEKLLIHRNSRY
jgi:hypothetical protein